MATVKEQMILKAVVEYTKTHTSFRNRHLMTMTGLDRQDINYYLKKWSKGGYVAQNPLVPGEWILVDMAGLVEDLTAGTDPIDLAHARKHPLFIDTELQKLRQMTDIYAALKMLKQNPSDLRRSLEEYIDEALKELRTERSYMHRKTFSKKRAAALLQKHAGMVKELGYKVPEMETEVKPLASRIEPEPEEEMDPLDTEYKRLSEALNADYKLEKNLTKYIEPFDKLFRRCEKADRQDLAKNIQTIMINAGI